MKRRTFDVITSSIGLLLAAVLLVAGALLTWANHFVADEVHSQLSAQKVYFPPKGSPAISAPEYKAVRQYAGQQLVTGAQAEAYADHFIAVHLKGIGGGKTYAQLSAQALADPTNTKLADQVSSMFRGETLRGLLLNAYAFATMGTIAGWAAVGAFVAAGLLLVLVALGLWHARRVDDTAEIFDHHPQPAPVPAAV